MKRILHAYKVFHPDSYGGIPEVLHQIITAPIKEIAHTLLVTRGKFGWGRYAHAPRLAIRYLAGLGAFIGQPLSPHYPLYLWFSARRADLLVIHLPFLWGDVAARAFLPRKLPLVVHWHSSITEEMVIYPLLAWLFRGTLKRAKKIIISDESIMSHSKLLSEFKDKCVVIPFGIDLEKWTHLTLPEQKRIAEIRQQHPRMIVSVGRLVPYKGYDVLIRAMVETDGELFIIGEGPERENLKNLIGALNLSHKVHLMGRQDDELVRCYLHAAKIFAFSSVSIAESFGIAQLEAMACGCAVVNTDLASAVPNVARNGQEGLTVPPHDPSALAAAMNLLLAKPELTEQLSQNALERVKDRFTQDRFVKGVYEVYDALLAGDSHD